MEIAVLGAGDQDWPSLSRTRDLYLQALKSRHNVHLVDVIEDAGGDIDAIVNFGGKSGWNALFQERVCPIIFVLHGGAVLDTYFIYKHLNITRKCDFFIGNCEADRNVIGSLSVAGLQPIVEALRLPVAPFGISDRAKADVRSGLGVATNELLIVAVSRLVPQKNIHLALRSLRRALDLNPDLRFKFAIVGNFWSDYRVLKNRSLNYAEWLRGELFRLGLEDKCILFPANLERAEVDSLIGAADISLSFTTSIDENFGYFAVESLAAGTPVLGAAYGGQIDSVMACDPALGLNTWWTPNGTRLDLVKAARRLASIDRAELIEKSERAREFSSERYSFESFKKNLLRLVERAISIGVASRKNEAVSELPVQSVSDPNCYEYDSLGDYEYSIQRYVSSDPPEALVGMQVCLSSPIRFKSREYVYLDDPVWPSKYSVLDTDMGLIDVINECDLYTIRNESESAVASKLVRSGLLVAEHRKC